MYTKTIATVHESALPRRSCDAPFAGYAYAQKRIRPFPLPRRGILAVLHNKIQLCLIACEMNGGFKCAFRNDF